MVGRLLEYFVRGWAALLVMVMIFLIIHVCMMFPFAIIVTLGFVGLILVIGAFIREVMKI